ncbi:MAG: hypothetical protein A2148_00265 [Chloroflexi bacterium RBG_16_68_14]|nr:MAG: hypothetical protein A2148_00265 [Chloroflexi bacterium RBG_16_68_14]
MRDLRGANAILTGGSRGIGPYIARALAREGVHIALAARGQERLEAVREEVEELGVRALTVSADIRLPEDRARLVDRVSAELGPIDLLINNAGVESTSEFVRLDPLTIESAIATNLTAAVLLMRMVLPGMVERRRGHVVNIASVAGKVPLPYDAVYSATKFGLVGLSHAVREELRGSGVGVSVVCPGFVANAGMFADIVAETGVRVPAIAGMSPPEQVAATVLRVIRYDVAEAVVTPLSGRPLLAVSYLSPTAGMAMMRQTGVVDTFRQIAQRRAAAGGDQRSTARGPEAPLSP